MYQRCTKVASLTYSVLKTAFCNKATSRTQTFKWHSYFKSGQTLVENSEHSVIHHQIDENVEKMCQVINEDMWHMIVTF
jgi:hypothetical protein